MKSETGKNTDSVPVDMDSVKNVIISALVGNAVRVHGLGLSTSAEMTESEGYAVLERVRSVGASARLVTCFCQGDVYSQMRHRSSNERAFASSFRKHFGVKVYNEVRGYGWVAEKWPKGQRDASKSWSWHRDNDPGAKTLKKPKPAVTLRIVGREVVDGVEWIWQVDDYGRQYVGKSESEI